MGEIFKQAIEQGLWAALTVFLIFYILKVQEKRDTKQEEREAKYQEIIAELTNQLNITKEVNENVNLIKEHIFKTDNNS